MKMDIEAVKLELKLLGFRDRHFSYKDALNSRWSLHTDHYNYDVWIFNNHGIYNAPIVEIQYRYDRGRIPFAFIKNMVQLECKVEDFNTFTLVLVAKGDEWHYGSTDYN